MSWDKLKNNPDALLEKAKDSSARGIAREYNLSKTTVTTWLNKHGFQYDREKDEWFDPAEEEEMRELEEMEDLNQSQQEDDSYQKIELDDKWVIVPEKKDNVEIEKETLRSIRRDYCDEIGNNHLTKAQITQKYGITKEKFNIIKRAFDFKHDSIRYTDKEFEENDVSDLVDNTLDQQKEQYMQLLEKKKIKRLERELNKYRKKDYFINQIKDFVGEDLEKFSKEYSPPSLNINSRKVESEGKMLEVPIVDLHLDKLISVADSEDVEDSLDLAEERFMNVVQKTINRVKKYNIEKVVLPFGNDFFHYDGSSEMTTNGTKMDVDTRWQKMYSRGIQLFVKAVDMFRQIAPDIKVIYVPGNHDWTISYFALEYFDAWFKDDRDVKVEVDPKSRKYVKYGENLIGYTHGDNIAKKRIRSLMQSEVPDKWADTEYREWHLGHIHSEQVEESVGVVVREMPSISPRDDWHYNKGYLSYDRCQVFLWGKKAGQLNIFVILPDS